MLALDHFDPNACQGEILGLLGPNGSGKTTAINCILALPTFESGDVRLFDEPMTLLAYDLKRRTGVVPQNVAIFNELTFQENIEYFCSLYVPHRTDRATLVRDAMAFVDLTDYARYRHRKLSGGLPRRLNIACAIAHRPDLPFFDEPTVAVDDSQSRNAILEGIKRLNREGATVSYTSHHTEEGEQICDRIKIMDHGKQLALGTADELNDLNNAGETITVETLDCDERTIAEITALPTVIEAAYDGKSTHIRCHQHLGYRTPSEVEARYDQTQATPVSQ